MSQNNKEIRIRAVLDSQGFDQQIQALQSRLNKMQRESEIASRGEEYGQGSKMSQITKSFYGDYNKESVQNLRETFNLNARKLQHEEREMRKKNKELKDLEKIETNISSTQKERLKTLKDEIDLLKQKGRVSLEENQKIADQARRLGSNLSGFKGVGGGVGGAEDIIGGMGGGRPYNLEAMGNYRQYRRMGFGRGISRGLTGIGGPMAVAGGIGAAIAGGAQATSSIWEELALKRGNIALAEGSAAGAMGGKLQQFQDPNKVMESSVFMPEYAKGMETAGKETESRRGRDILKGATSSWANIVAQGMAGFAMGNVPGALIGVGSGMATNLAFSKQNREALLGTEEYKKRITAEGLQRGEQIGQAERLANIPKTLAFSGFQKQLPNIMQSEALFGEEKPIDLLKQYSEEGLRGQTAMRIRQSMMGASGVTDQSPQEVRSAYDLTRAGLTNAPQISGAIKGLAKGYGEQATDESIKKLFSEAVKFGINDSKMVEEMRQFSTAAVNLAMATGIRVEEAAGLLSQGSMGEFSAANLKAAQNALQFMNQESQNVDTQAFKMAFMSSQKGNELFGDLDEDQKIRLMHMAPTDVSQDNLVVQNMMKRLGLEGDEGFEEFDKRFRKLQMRGTIKYGPLAKRMEEFGDMPEGTEEERELKAKEEGDILTKMQNLLPGMTFRSSRELLGKLTGQKDTEEGTVTGSDIYDEMKKKGAGSVGAGIEEGMAKAEGQQLKNLSQTDPTTGLSYAESFVNQMKNANAGASELREVMQQMKEAAGQSTEALSVFAKVLNAYNTGDKDKFLEEFEKGSKILNDLTEPTPPPTAVPQSGMGGMRNK